MSDKNASLEMFDQDKLKPEARDAALAAARTALSRKNVTASAVVHAYATDLMLAGVSDGDKHTGDHYREHGASLHAFKAYHAARDAASAEIARLDPANAGFYILFSLAH